MYFFVYVYPIESYIPLSSPFFHGEHQGTTAQHQLRTQDRGHGDGLKRKENSAEI